MKAGTIIKLSDGRIGTVNYHQLDGYGILWGEQKVDESDNLVPDAMLRDPFPNTIAPCVGTKYTIKKEAPVDDN